jgi:hypothetical protein
MYQVYCTCSMYVIICSRQHALLMSETPLIAIRHRNCTGIHIAITLVYIFISVADPDVYPGYRILIFVHLGSGPGAKNRNKREGEKNLLVVPFFQRIKSYFIFNQVKKKLWANLQRGIERFIQKIVIKLSKISWVWDPGLEI